MTGVVTGRPLFLTVSPFCGILEKPGHFPTPFSFHWGQDKTVGQSSMVKSPGMTPGPETALRRGWGSVRPL